MYVSCITREASRSGEVRLAVCTTLSQAVSTDVQTPAPPPPAGRRHKRRLLRPARFPPTGRRRPPRICRHRGERPPPPPTRIARTGMRSSLKMVSVSLRLKATPSMMARTTLARVWSAANPTRSTGVGVQMRGALAHQIGRPENSPGTRGNLRGFGAQLIIGISLVGTPRLSATPKLSRNQRRDRPAAG